MDNQKNNPDPIPTIDNENVVETSSTVSDDKQKREYKKELVHNLKVINYLKVLTVVIFATILIYSIMFFVHQHKLNNIQQEVQLADQQLQITQNNFYNTKLHQMQSQIDLLLSNEK